MNKLAALLVMVLAIVILTACTSDTVTPTTLTIPLTIEERSYGYNSAVVTNLDTGEPSNWKWK